MIVVKLILIGVFAVTFDALAVFFTVWLAVKAVQAFENKAKT